MSEVNLQFTVNSFSSVFTVESTALTIDPQATQLTVYSGYTSQPPAGSAGNTQVAFNDGGVFGGSNNFTFNKTSNTMIVNVGNIANVNSLFTVSSNVTAGNLSVLSKSNLNNVSNITILGGTAGQYLRTDGAGNVSFQTVPNTVPGGSSTQLQYNDGGVFAGIPTVTWSANKLDLGTASNVKINGGTNGYFLQTDGSGNITWVAGGGSGNGVVGGSNTQVQFNDSGAFGGSANLVFDKASGLLTVATVSGNIQGTGNLTALTVNGTTTIQQGVEKITITSSAPSANVNFDVLSNAIQYYTSTMTANVTLNIRGNGSTTFNTFASVGDSVTIAFVTNVGATQYAVTQLQIDGTNITPKWVTGLAAAPNYVQVNSCVTYGYTIIKTAANTYTTLASFTGYK